MTASRAFHITEHVLNRYDNYLETDGSSKETNRQSGLEAVGAGLLGMDEDEDEDEDENDSTVSDHPASKNAVLAAATAPAKSQNQHQMNIAAPRPGYAAPIAALNGIPSPEPAAAPHCRRPSADAEMPLSNPFVSSMENPFDPVAIRAHHGGSPSPSLSPIPHPLQPPITPIRPVFARPAKPTGITFDEKPKVTRTERGALPSRGEKGDDFWRRFSMVAKEPTARGERFVSICPSRQPSNCFVQPLAKAEPKRLFSFFTLDMVLWHNYTHSMF